MEKLNKTVKIGCLIYGLYGLMSWLEIGTFVPPIPLKPILFFVFLIAFVVNIQRFDSKLLNGFVLSWLITLVFVGQYLVEMLFSYKGIYFYLNSIEPYAFLLSVTSFIVLVLVFLRKMNYRPIYILIFSFMLILFIVLLLFTDIKNLYEWSTVVIALMFLVFNRNKNDLNKNFQKVQIILIGVGTINGLEQLAFMLQ